MHPSEIAREALKRLASRKLLPTPANYQQCYNEIAQLPNIAGFPDGNLRQIALALKAGNAEQQKQLDQLDKAIGRHSWQGMVEAIAAFSKGAANSAHSKPAEPAVASGDTLQAQRSDLLGKLAQTIECLQPALETDEGLSSEFVTSLLHTLRDPAASLQIVQSELTLFNHRLKFAAEEQAEIKQTLLGLLHLIIENISKLLIEDAWFDGQMQALLEATQPPLSLRRLDDVERRIQDVILKQVAIKQRYLQAQEEMRQLLATFIEWLSSMGKSSEKFQQQLEADAKRIERIKTIEEMAPLLKDVIDATRTMAEDTVRARDQLQTLQQREAATEAELAKLHQELEHASAQAHHDPLTNTLNRKGLDEALAKEVANTRRKGLPLSLAVLDIDNFKKLNDQLGHKTGDAALIHLVNVVRDNLRPSDSLARYGGEEFVIVMPDTEQAAGIQILIRLQRSLTKNFFLAGTEKILITFSAGVAQMIGDEFCGDTLERADQAMYLAKRTGKNRVVGG